MRGEFRGTERFEVLRRLGAGGMGVVYEAFDRQRGERVALKTMLLRDPAAIYRFKNEFRALADVSHPNLITLYEMFSSDEDLFFTMELVAGRTFVQWTSGGRGTDPLEETLPAPPRAEGVTTAHVEPRASWPSFDEALLRKALPQLASAVHALHASGKLHRDIKPSNILVDEAGRVVLLDFGLVTEIEGDARGRTVEELVGTPEYMAPEQGAGMQLSEASDWYGVGVILYEALTGQLPFTGARMKVLMDKHTIDPPRPAKLVPNLPEDLETLCCDLLERDPAQRPRGRDVLRRLGVGTQNEKARSLVNVVSTINAPFLGRASHLRILNDALAETARGTPTAALVHGASGMGKSVLVRRFLDSLGADAVVLAGRCYEQETVPFKAFDEIIDSLSRYLIKRKRDAIGFLPRDIHTLSRVFPVLRRVEAIASSPRPQFETPDPQELRRRAFRALRELFARLGDRETLVVWIDDVQWGDADSAVLINELLRPPEAPRMLFIASYRSDDASTGELLPAFLAAEHARDARVIEVRALERADAIALASSLLGDGNADHAEEIAAEAAGSPYFVDELVRYVHSGVAMRRSTDGRAIRLDDVLGNRLDQLPDAARRLLETLAVAGRPIPRELALRAADVRSEEQRAALAVLRVGRCVRTQRINDDETLATFHDRIRETTVASLSPEELAARHRALATALEGRNDEEGLARHWRAAGDRERAREHAGRAADHAAEALAFDRAAAFYVDALDGLEDREERRAILWKLGDAQASAGRGAEAGHAYLEAAAGARAADALELQRRAAEQFLRSGHIDEGVATLRLVLAAVGMHLPSTSRGALFSILIRMVWLAIRGLGYRERDPSQITAEDITRIDICWSVNAGLAVVDNIRSIDFQKRQLLLALRAGEPYRVARALATECAASSVEGTRVAKRTARIAALAQELAERVPQPHARGFAMLVRGIAEFLQGNWRSALRLAEDAERVFRDRCTGVWWEIVNTQIFSLWSLTQLGELAELERRMPILLDEAQARGDVYLFTNLQIGRNNVRWLALDRPELAAQVVDEAMARWPKTPIHLQH